MKNPIQAKFDGFTLIELLVVVLIIGILSAIALPQYQKAVRRSRGVELRVLLKTLSDTANMYYLEHGEYPVIKTGETTKETVESLLGMEMPRPSHFLIGCADDGNWETPFSCSKTQCALYFRSKEYPNPNSAISCGVQSGKSLDFDACSKTTISKDYLGIQ